MATSRLLGYKLRTLRRRHGMTTQELAQQLGTSSGYISMVENEQREPRTTFVFKAAQFFNVSTDVLLNDDLDLPEP